MNKKTPQPETLSSSRREMIKRSAATVVGAAAYSASSPVSRAADNKILKLGLIGCGGRGSGAARQALKADDRVELVAMADLFEKQMENSLGVLKKSDIGERVKVSKDKQFLGLDAYKKVLDSDVDVVILATPPGFRAKFIADAIDAGKHVFAEKPGATDAAGALSILDSAKKAEAKGLFLVAGLQARYEPTTIEMVKRIRNGDIGDVNSMRITRYLGPIKAYERKEGMTDLEYQIVNWQYYTWMSGDGMVELFIHELDRMAWIAGEHPVSCISTGGRQTRTGKIHGNVFDHFAAVYKFPSGLELYASTRQQLGCDRLFDMVVTGTKGRCDGKSKTNYTISGDKPWVSIPKRKPGTRRKRVRAAGQLGHQLEHDAMYAALRAGKYINNGDYYAKSTLMAIMGRDSAYLGKEIFLKDVIANPQRLVPENITWDMKLPDWKVAMPGQHGII